MMKTFKFFIEKLLAPITSLRKIKELIPEYIKYFRSWKKYSKMDGAESLLLKNLVPCLFDDLPSTPYDSHYFYQDIWAFKKIFNSKFTEHVDVGSNIYFVGFLSVIKKVIFIDIRPLKIDLDNFRAKKGTIISLPYPDNSIESISCLHVAEHIGLGRYGDELDPKGTFKAIKELSRVLATNGDLFFSIPIGKPKLCFNGHRIHSTQQILSYFDGLKLIELSGVDDNGKFIQNIDPIILDNCEYGCGFFRFTK